MTLKELVKEAHNNSKEKGWWDGNNHNIPEKLMLIVSEVSEALEDYRVQNEPLNAIKVDDKGKPVGFASELSDVLIRCFDLSGFLNIDLEKVIEMKIEYNKKREYRHGGKRC